MNKKFGPDHLLCSQCLMPFDPKTLLKGRCAGCVAKKKALGRKELMASDTRAISKAARSLTARLNRSKDDASVMPDVAEAFLLKIGGGDVTSGKRTLGEYLAEDFLRSRGIGLTADELENFDRSDFATQNYYKIAIDFLRRLDDTKVVDISGLTDEDLKATLRTVALEQIAADPQFRKSVLAEAISVDPEVRKEVMELGGEQVIEELSKVELDNDIEYDTDESYLEDNDDE